MTTRRLSVVLSCGQTLHPERQALESQLADQLLQVGQCDVLVVPHLYDLNAAGPGVAALQDLSGDLVVLAWLYPRAAHWILDRHGVRGRSGRTRLDEDEKLAADEGQSEPAEGTGRVAATRDLPDRTIYCLDLRRHRSPQPYLDAIQQVIPAVSAREAGGEVHTVRRIEEPVGRRWYPVVDYSRCTDCMECIDFCLFGVYGVDEAEHVLVELPDNCRKGCPACSRVCPENAIMFPQHKTPAIAGELRETGGLKLDLSSLFGAAEGLSNDLDVAIRERDEHLLSAGQRPAGKTDPVPKPRASETGARGEDLDKLIDRLDALDL